jgi:hypothetical protein
MIRRIKAAHAAASVLIVASALAVGAVIQRVHAHGTEARRVELLSWTRDRIVRVIGANRSELGLNGSKVPTEFKRIGGMACLFGDLFAFDVEDSYAFDIDEPVDLTVTYAPEFTQPFTIAWDQNGGDGFGRSTEITPERGQLLRQVTVTLQRARLAGFGILRTDLAVAARGGIALCDLAIARRGAARPESAVGSIRIDVRDAASGRTVPARLGLYDSSGRTPLPSDDAILVHRYADETRLFWVAPQLMWPATSRQAFYTSGVYEAQVPTGTYQIVATKGPEYRVYRGTLDVRAGQTTSTTVALQRYIDQAARGWYSGDTHLHLMRDQVDDLAVWGQIAAEDVYVGNLLEMGNIVTTHFRQPAWGQAGRFFRDGHMIASGQEDPRTTQRGHTIHHNLRQPIHLPQDEFFSYHKVFEASHEQGGVSGYAHHGQLFNGRRGLALDVPFGLVDFIEVLQGGRLDTAAWYPFLDLGYKVNPAAGSDYPYFGPSLPGAERYYVKLDGAFDPDAWYAAFKAGQVFVTNGPMLDFTINGTAMGREVRVAKGARLDLRGMARLNPDVDALDRVEVVAHGNVIAMERASGRDQVELRHELVADRSMWIAVRAFGARPPQTSGQGRQLSAVAHSAPIYVVVDGQPFWNTPEVAQRVKEQRQHLQDLLSAPVDPMGDLEAWETVDVLSRQWERQRNQLRPRVAEADAKYADILKRATGAVPSSAGGVGGPGLMLAALVGVMSLRLRGRTGNRADRPRANV